MEPALADNLGAGSNLEASLEVESTDPGGGLELTPADSLGVALESTSAKRGRGSLRDAARARLAVDSAYPESMDQSRSSLVFTALNSELLIDDIGAFICSMSSFGGSLTGSSVELEFPRPSPNAGGIRFGAVMYPIKEQAG